jgi:hypothetical protein
MDNIDIIDPNFSLDNFSKEYLGGGSYISENNFSYSIFMYIFISILVIGGGYLFYKYYKNRKLNYVNEGNENNEVNENSVDCPGGFCVMNNDKEV